MSEEYPVPEGPWNSIESTESLKPVEPETATPDQIEEAGTGPEADLPPEAQGEANGGPLGCCLGATIGLVLSLFVAVFGRLYLANPLVDTFHNPMLVLILLRIVMGIVTIGGAILLGIVGWKVGKKLFREYEPPVVPVKLKRKRRKAKIRPKEA